MPPRRKKQVRTKHSKTIRKKRLAKKKTLREQKSKTIF